MNRRVGDRSFRRRQLELGVGDAVSGRVDDAKDEWLGERLARRAALTVAGDDDETDGGASARRCVHRQWRDGTLAMTTTDLRAETLHAGFRAERPDRTRFADGVR